MINLLISFLLIIIFTSCKNENQTFNIETGVQHLNSPADSVSAEPYLFTDKNGLVYLSWIQKTNDSATLKYALLSNEEWTDPITITAGIDWFVNWADYPMLASDGNKNLLAHILQKSAGGKYTYDVKFTTSNDNGKTWNDLKILHDDGKQAEHGFVAILPYENQFLLSWLDGRNTVNQDNDTASHHDGGHHGSMTLRGAVVNINGTKIDEWELDNKVCDCCQTSTALTSNGPVIIYRDRSDEEIRDISIVRFINDNWTKPKNVFPDQWKIDGCPVNGPRSAAEGNVLAIAWFSSSGHQPQVKVIFSDDGGENFRTPIRISEKNTIGRVDVVMLDEKSAMVSWIEDGLLKVRKVYKDGKIESSMIIASTSESRSSGFPQMTKSGNQIIFAWTDDKEKRIKVAKAVF